MQTIQTDREGSIAKEAVIKSSGNVLFDLGFSPEEVAIFQMRSEVLSDLRKFMKNKKIMQAMAAHFVLYMNECFKS